MPSGSLNNMSVPIDGSAGGALIHPKLKYRFRVLFLNMGISDTKDLSKQVMNVTRPNLEHDQIICDVYNSRIFLVGKHTWQPIDLQVRDDMENTVQKIVGEQLQRQVDHYQQSSAKAGEDYKFTTKIEVLDGGNGKDQPTILESWVLLGCYITNSNFNDLNYAESEQASINFSIQYDNAVQELGEGVGHHGTVRPDQGSLVTNSAGSVAAGG